MTSLQLAQSYATKAPPGVRLGGPGTRSKNPKRYDSKKKPKEGDANV